MNIVDEYGWNTGFQQRSKKKTKLLQAGLDQNYISKLSELILNFFLM